MTKSDLMTYIFKTIPIILLFAKSKCSVKVVDDLTEELVGHARKITSKALLINNAQLRGKYKNMAETSSMECRVKEVEMQVLLRLEMEALLPTEIEKNEKPSEQNGKQDKENVAEEENKESILDMSSSEEVSLPEELRETVDEMVTMLQSIPILVDHSRLTTFLEDVVSNYHNILGPILKVIYDDLMISKPDQLMSPSQNSQVLSVKPPASMEPPSSYGSLTMSSTSVAQRSRSLVRHPSFDVGSKRVIPVVIKKDTSKKTKEKKEKKKKKEQEDDQTKRVCRNLFTGDSEGPVRRSPRKKFNKLPRRQSVAVMETAAKRWTSPRRRTPGKSPSRLVLKTRIVKETPGKKQVLQAMLKKQERARQHTKTDKSTEMAAVEESPDKIVKETPFPKKRTPPGKSRPKMTRHHSHKNLFYSKKSPRSSRARNLKAKEELSKAINLGARIAGKTPEAKPISSRLLHTRTKSASAVRVFSNYASPATLMQQRRIPVDKGGDDSPSKNTRSQVVVSPKVLSSPKSSKKSPFKSPRRVASRSLWTSPNRSTQQSVFKSPSKTPPKTARKLIVEDTPDKSTRRGHIAVSPKNSSSVKTSVKSPLKMTGRTAKKGSPLRMPRKSPSKVTITTPEEGSLVKTPKKSSSKMTTATIKQGSPVRTPKKSPSRMVTRTSTPVKIATTPNKMPLKGSIKESPNRTPDSKRRSAPSHKTRENLGGDQAMSQARLSKATASVPCELCSIEGQHSHSNRQPSSISFLHSSEMSSRCYSTSSSLEDVFESPSSGVKSPSRKTSGTPELIRVWKQKKPQNGTPPRSSKVLSPRSSTKSDSPVFGAEDTPAKRTSTSPYASNRQRIVRQPAGEKRATSSPTFGKHTPSPKRRKSSRSPASTSKQSKMSGKVGSAKKTKLHKKCANTNISILSYLDIKGMKINEEEAATQNEGNTLLEVAESQHEESQERSRSRKRVRNDEEEEEMKPFKKQRSVQDDDVTLLSDGEELFDIGTLLDSNSDEEIDITFPTGNIDLTIPDSSNTGDIASVKDFLSPPKKSKLARSPRVITTRKRSSELEHTMSKTENVGVPNWDNNSSENRGPQGSCKLAATESNSASGSSVATQEHSKHRSFRKLPTRRSLAKRMSSGNSSSSDQMVMSPMFSDDSLQLSEEDDEGFKCLPVPQKATFAASNEPNKRQHFTPVSKKGLADLINSPLVNSSERLKTKARDKGTSSRRHVSFSSE